MIGLENFIDEVKNTEFDMTFKGPFLSEGKMVVALASLMFLIGTGVSVGGCVLRARDRMRSQIDSQKAEKVQTGEQKVQPLMNKNLFVCR